MYATLPVLQSAGFFIDLVTDLNNGAVGSYQLPFQIPPGATVMFSSVIYDNVDATAGTEVEFYVTGGDLLLAINTFPGPINGVQTNTLNFRNDTTRPKNIIVEIITNPVLSGTITLNYIYLYNA